MYKKLLTVIAALALVLSAAACGKTDASPESTTGATQQTVPTQTETTAPAPAAEPQFEQIPLVDDANCTVVITGIEEDGMFGYSLNVFLENKTDMDLMFTVENVSVNGYMCDPFWAVTVAAGKKANEQITFFESDFETNGIQEVTDITFTWNVYDSNDWTADYLVSETLTVNP